jgi:hypothetical protein
MSLGLGRSRPRCRSYALNEHGGGASARAVPMLVVLVWVCTGQRRRFATRDACLVQWGQVHLHCVRAHIQGIWNLALYENATSVEVLCMRGDGRPSEAPCHRVAASGEHTGWSTTAAPGDGAYGAHKAAAFAVRGI